MRFFMKSLSDNFEKMTSALKDTLLNQEFVCTTCDVWTCRGQSYIGMTVHFLTNDFERKSFVLSFRQLKGRQTNEELSTEIAQVLNEFSLSKDKVTHVVTDGCSAFTKGFRLFGSQDQMAKQSEFEDIPNEDESNPEDDAQFMQNEDGEFFEANEINLPSADNMVPNDLDDEDTTESEHVTNSESSEQQTLLDGLVANENERETSNTTIELPPQRRCVSHQLHLVANDFEKKLPVNPNQLLVNAVSKLQQLWVRTHKSAMAKTICKEVTVLRLLRSIKQHTKFFFILSIGIKLCIASTSGHQME